MPDLDTLRALKAIRALREPDASLARVPNTVRQSIADVIVELLQNIEQLEQRQRSTEWLQRAAFLILAENNIMPSSRELIDANKRALIAEAEADTPPEHMRGPMGG